MKAQYLVAKRVAILVATLIPLSAGVVHALTPTAKFAFVASGQDDSVVQFKVKSSGVLSPNSPPSVPAGNFPGTLLALKRNGRIFVYAANGNGTTISQYKLGTGGVLIPNSPPDLDLVTVSPEYIVSDPKHRFAYVTTFDRDIAQLRINSDGTLTPSNPPEVLAPAGSGTVRPAVDRRGKFLFVPEFGHDTVLQYKINSDGTLTSNLPASIGTGSNPRQVALSPSGKFAYVPNLSDGTISQYTVGADGTLSANTPSIVTLPPGAAPVQVVISPNGRFAWVVDEDLGAVYQFKIGTDGTLTANTTPSVPVLFASFMALDAGGRFGYVDDGGSLVYQFKIDGHGLMSPNPPPPASNSVSAGVFNGDIVLVK
jgi:6-phosphogluconolactonase (cycloisomerase 2 family)